MCRKTTEGFSLKKKLDRYMKDDFISLNSYCRAYRQEIIKETNTNIINNKIRKKYSR